MLHFSVAWQIIFLATKVNSLCLCQMREKEWLSILDQLGVGRAKDHKCHCQEVGKSVEN